MNPLALGWPALSLGADLDLLVFFGIGVLGGAHCLGMCGPLVSTYAERMSDATPAGRARVTLYDVRQHGLFNLGRTLGYATVGAILGLLGSVVIVTTAQFGGIANPIRGGLGVAIGLVILVIGAGYLVRGTGGGPLSHIPGLSRASTLIRGPMDRLVNSVGIVGLGTLHAFLPCPILYPAYLYALALGDPVRGAIALALLGLGTIPTLLVYGLAIGSIAVDHRRHLHRALGITFLILGYIPFAHGLALLGLYLPRPAIPIYQPLG